MLIPTVSNVHTTLLQLGPNPGIVATNLRRLGVKGERASCSRCPIAWWIHRLFPTVPIENIEIECPRWKIRGVGSAPLPDAILAFVQLFDAGRHPTLIHYE